MARREHDFSAPVIRALQDRVNHHCSNPDCQAPTRGPHTDPLKSTSVGTASHIYAAAPKGPRARPDLQDDEFLSCVDNGIWLCITCGTKIDKDPASYPPELLNAWKHLAVTRAELNLGRPAALAAPAAPKYDVLLSITKAVVDREPTRHHYHALLNFANNGSARFDDWYFELEFPTALLLPNFTPALDKIATRSNKKTTLYRSRTGLGPLHGGDTHTHRFPFDVTLEMFERDDETNMFDQLVKTRMFVNGHLAGETSKPFREIQDF